MPLLTRKAIILAKIETTYGQDANPTGAANAILVRNVNLTPLATEFVDRALVRPYLGNSERLPAAQFVQLEFEVEIAGGGAPAGTPPKYGPLLRACGMSETINAGVSVVYAPVSAGFEALSIYHNQDGVLHRLLGARGSVALAFTSKQIPVYRFRFMGLWVQVTDTAAPTPDYAAFVTPSTVNNVNTPTFSIHGVADSVAPMQECTLDLANNVVFRSLVGSELVLITDRQPAGSLMIEATTVAQKDWWTAIKNAVTGALQIVHGTAAGNIVTVAAPNAQLTEPRYVDSDGVTMLQANLALIPGSAGNDELTITCT